MRKWLWLLSSVLLFCCTICSASGATGSVGKDVQDQLQHGSQITNAQRLQKSDTHTAIVEGASEKLAANNLTVARMLPDWRDQFLQFITHPNVAFLLMLAAIYGIFFELSNPGFVLPGVVGIISLLLVLYAFQLMPINYAGLGLIVVGIGFMIVEIYVTSFGTLGIGGVIAFCIGAIMLFDMNNDPHYRLSWALVLSMGLVTSAFFFMIMTLALRAHKKAIVTGKEGLIGSVGVVMSVMNEQVIVRVAGEIWEARSSVMLTEGQKVTVTKLTGLILTVTPSNDQTLKAGD